MADRLLKVTSPLMSGSDVKEFQTLVTDRGFSVTVDGMYGEKCKEACKKFQKQCGLSADGMCGEKTWSALRNRRTLKATSPIMKGSDVKEFQTLVEKHGFDVGSIDGKYGKGSQTACKNFQKAKGLSVDGICGTNTWKELDKAPSTSRRTLKVTSPLMEGSDVKEFQTLIQKHGFSAGSIDGKYGNNSKNACISFQRSKGLSADGICGKDTWAALDKAPSGGSGSDKPHTAHITWEEFNKCHNSKLQKYWTDCPPQYYANAQGIMDRVEAVRAELNRQFAKSGEEIQIVIRSGYRGPAYNAKDGGAKNSQHLYAKAIDFYAVKVHADGTKEAHVPNCYQIGLIVENMYKTGGTGYGSNTNVHMDTRAGRARWWYTYKSWGSWKSHQGKQG